jgi:hypothetical protein
MNKEEQPSKKETKSDISEKLFHFFNRYHLDTFILPVVGLAIALLIWTIISGSSTSITTVDDWGGKVTKITRKGIAQDLPSPIETCAFRETRRARSRDFTFCLAFFKARSSRIFYRTSYRNADWFFVRFVKKIHLNF